jgi:SAM-dependent methyltransferase
MSHEDKARRSRSFGRVAAHYDRYRPGPPPEAVDWLLPTPLSTVVDVGAGTGALTRLLAGRANTVIAVEPDPEMREVLLAEVPGATVVDGRGESMPLPDGTADAVLASSSWHWVDPVPGLGEVARVLVPNGLLGALWAGPDPESPFVVQARELLGGVATDDAGAKGATAAVQVMSASSLQSNFALEIPSGLPFSAPDHEVFRWDMALTADDLVGLLGTLSWVILMEPAERQALYSLTRRLLRDALGVEGDVTVDVTFRCDAYRSQLHT